MAVIWDGNSNVVADGDDLGEITFNFDPVEEIANIQNVNGNVVFTTRDGHTFTITGVTLSQIAAGDIVIGDGSSAVIFGDGTRSTIVDNVGNTIDASGYDITILMGLGGSDTITATGYGNNLVFGGSAAGDSSDVRDVIETGYGSDVVFGNNGDDYIVDRGGAANELIGGSGNDEITVTAFSGEDYFRDSTIWGGNGADEIYVDWATGTTTIYGGNGVSDTGDEADVISIWTDGDTNVYGNAGNDELNVYVYDYDTVGNGTVYGGMGDDTFDLYGDAGTTVTAFGGQDSDDIYYWGYGDAAIYGGGSAGDTTDAADVIEFYGWGDGDSGTYSVYGNAGNDDIYGETGVGTDTSVFGGQGNDTIELYAAADDATSTLVVSGGLGQDTLTVDSDGTATVYGGNEAGDPADTADEITVTGAGTFDVYGNGGSDVIEVTLSGVTGSADVLQGFANVYGGQGDDEINLNGEGSYFVKAGVGDDTITTDLNAAAVAYDGTNATAELFGNQDADTFVVTFDTTGDTGSEVAFVEIQDYDRGEGDVVAIVGSNADADPLNLLFDGGTGQLYLEDMNGNGTFDLGYVSGTDGVIIEAGAQELTQIDFADGSLIFDGDNEGHTLLGGDGNDVLWDGGYFGIIGEDIGVGDGELADVFDGGAGDDFLIGGIAGDLMTGGEGDDTFFYQNPTQSTLESYGVITDFTTGEDTLDLRFATSGNVTFEAQVGDLASVYDSVEEAANALADQSNGSDSAVIAFSFHDQTYVLVDNSSEDFFTENDLFIQLQGDTTIVQSDILTNDVVVL